MADSSGAPPLERVFCRTMQFLVIAFALLGAAFGQLQSQYAGYPGYAGYKGYTGYPGYVGYQGYQGYQGYPGYQGYAGYQGYPGYQGYAGYNKGYLGYSGYPGYTAGYTGYQGYPGYTGIAPIPALVKPAEDAKTKVAIKPIVPIVPIAPVAPIAPIAPIVPVPIPAITRGAVPIIPKAVIDGPRAAIRSQSQDSAPDGSYAWRYETENGILAAESGSPRLNPDGPEEVVVGEYAYTAPDGTPIAVRYTADKNGFHPEGVHLPANGDYYRSVPVPYAGYPGIISPIVKAVEVKEEPEKEEKEEKKEKK